MVYQISERNASLVKLERKKSSNVFEIAKIQLEIAAKRMNLNPDILNQLKEPERVLMVSVPVRMDNGEVKVFQGYRSQFNTARGPAKGGVRYHP